MVDTQPMEIPPTLLHALHTRASQTPERPALWTKRHGFYVPRSWRDYAARVRHLALALIARGLQPGEVVGIAGSNREEWVVSYLAAMAAGAVPTGLYTTSTPEELGGVLGQCEASVVVVENAEQLARIAAAVHLRPQLPRLRWVVTMDTLPPMELPGSPPIEVLSVEQLLGLGRGQAEGPYWDRVNALTPSGLAALISTPGTTGQPKAVMLSHRNLCWTAARMAEVGELGEREVQISYLPLPQIAEQLSTVHLALVAGVQVFFAEGQDALPQNLREVRPTVFFGVPRVWEMFKARAEEAIRELPQSRARMLRWARDVALDYHRRLLARERIPTRIQVQYEAAARLVLSPLKSRIGFDRARLLISSAAPMRLDVLEFFASLDLVIREIYGQSEVTGVTSVNTIWETRFGSLGRPLLGVQLRIAEDGEILVRGDNVCLGYDRDRQATAELLEGGWLHSGDLGELDPEGYLRITSRKQDVLVTSGRKKTSPASIEVMLEALEPVGHAVVVGERRKFLAALLTLDPERAPAFARQRGWPVELDALAQSEALKTWLTEEVDKQVNRRLARFEGIKKFAVLPRDFTVEGGELTPTLEVRRREVAKKYAEQIDALYRP